MNRTILLALVWCLATLVPVAAGDPVVTSPAKAIVLIIDPAARQSEVVKQVVEALEKAGIAKAERSDTAAPSNSKISVTLSIRPDVSFEKIKHLIEALQKVGASQIAFRAMEIPADWKETHNFIRLIAQPDYSTEELLRIEQAIEASAIERGLEYLLEKQIPGQAPALTHHAAATPKQAPAATDSPASESETKVLTVDGCTATDVAQLLKHLQPDPAFQAFGNNGAFRLVISGTPEQLKSAEATVSRMQELLTQIRQGENRLFELLKTLGTEHPNVLKLNAELEALDTEIVKLESGFKHYNPPKRIEEFKSPPKLGSTVPEPDPPVDHNKLLKLGIVLHRITPQKAAQLLKLVIDDDTFTAVPEENSNILRVTGTKLHFEILESVLKQVEQPAKGAHPQSDQEETLFQSAEALERQRDPASADSGKTEGIDPPVDANDANEPSDPDYEKSVILRIDGGPESYAIIPPLQAALGKLRIALAPVDFAQNKPDRKDDFHVTLVMRSEESPENIATLIDWMTEREIYDFTFSTMENPTNVVLIHVWNETLAVQQLIESLQNPVDSPVKFNVVRRDLPKGTASVKVFALQYAQATEVAEVLKQVYDKGPSKIVPDARTNSVIVTGPEAQLQEIEALLLKLDEGGPANPNARSVPVGPAQSEAAKLVAQLEDELAQLQQSVEANHPKVKELQGRIAAARQNVQPETASRLPGTPATNVNPLGEIEHLDAEGERLRQRLEADKKNLERSQALMKEGLYSVQKAQEAEAPVRLTEALLAAHEAQRSAVLQKFKAQLLKALDDALEYFQSSGQIEKAELQDAEKQIEAIITQVDTSPQQALAAANHLISQLDSELVKRLEKAIESSPTDPKIGTWQTALRQAQRRARTRKLLPGSLPATEAMFGKYDRAFQAQTEAGSRLPAVSPGNGDGTGSTSQEVQQQIAQLRKEYEAADSEARQLAQQLQRTPDEAQKNEAQKAELRRAVQRAFTARQSLLRAELLEMHDKLLKTQRSIDLRERISDQIIQRRVEDLLNPQLEWEGTSPPQSTSDNPVSSAPTENPSQAASVNPPSDLAPIGLGLPEKISDLAWGEPQNGLRLAIVIPTESALWNQSQEILYIVENVSSRSIPIRGQRSAQLAKLCEVRTTSQSQVQTVPIGANDGEQGSPIELPPGAKAVVGRVRLYVTEQMADPVPKNVELRIVDSEAWKHKNAIYVLQGTLPPDPERPTVTIQSGQVGVAFYQPNPPNRASAAIPKGMRVFTFSANETHTHSSLLRPGDKVDVTVTFVDRKGNLVTKVLLECIEVFATEINAVHSDEDQNKQRPRSVSLLVTPEQDGFVKIAQSKGQLALSLRHPDDADVKNVNGINSAIMEDLQRSIGEHDRSLPLITSAQETRWRSAVVEILVSGKSDAPDQSPRKVGFGVIVAADGTMLSHMGGGWSSTIKDWPNIDAQFDDGSIVPLQIVDAGGSGFVVLRPKQSVNLNHHFPLSGTTTGIGDQVYVGWMIQTSPDRNYYRLSATAMPLAETDRRVASLGEPVWQLALKQRIPNSLCHPVLSKDGELLAITLTDTGELLLAVPVDKLREILPQSVGKLPVGSTAIRSAVPTVPDADGGADLQSALLARLQGDWSFRGQPIDKDEPQGLRTDVNIKGDLMTFKLTLPDGRQGEASHQIKLGRAGPPQQIDVIFDPNGGTQRMECKGIIEIDAEVVRICLDNSSDSQRPEVFAAGSNAEIWELRRKPSEKPASPAASTPSDPQTAMQAKLQGQWHLTIHPTSVLGMGLFLKDSEEAEAVIEGQVMKVFYKKALGANLLEDDRDPFLAYTVKVTFGETGSPQPVDLLFGPNEEPVNRRLALGIAEFSDDVIRLCFDRATESESIRPEVFAVGAKGEIWELRREPPAGSRGYVLDRLQGVWQGTWKPDFTLPNGLEVPTVDGIVHIQGSRMAVSWQPDEEIEVRLGASGPAQNIDLLFNDRKTKATNELLGVVDVSDDQIILRLGDCNEEDRPKSIVGTNDEATFTLKLSKLQPGAFPDLGAQCELAGPLPQGAGQGKFRGGLRIAKVFAGTPAAQGGLAAGDILVGFHIWEMTRLEDLQYALAQKLKGEVSFHVIRSGVVRKGYVLLDGTKRPDSDAELSPDQLTKIPVEYDHGIAIPAAQLQKVFPKAREQQQETPGESKTPAVEADPRENEDNQDSRLSPLHGRWKVDYFVSPNRAEQWERVEIEGSTLTCFGAIDEKSGFARVYRLSLGSPDDPRAVDLRETEGNQTFPGLMEKTRDGLALCLGLDGQRPAEFGDGDQRICLRLIPQPKEPEPSPAPADPKASSSDSEKQPSSQQ